ncbi:MAG: ABC transporter permease [Desulfobacteraceae bacterium]|nr:ABC transporter permease [Desulfobacteraceae bacterium]
MNPMQVLADGTFHRFSISFRGVFEKYGIYIFLGLLFVTASLVSPQFLNPQNLKDILNQAAALGMVAIGQTFVILIGGGGLDLSVASVMATVAVIVAHNTQGQDALFFPVAMVCLLFGLLVGLANGLLITKRKVQPFMATICMMIIIQGLRFLYTGGAPKGGFPPILRFLGTGNIGPVPTSIFSLAILAVVTVIVLKKTTLGRQIYVIGGNIETAYLSGYRIDLIITVVYVISGFTAAIAGLYLAGYIGVSDNWVGKGYELDSIAAVVMGGTSFAGGRGGVMGTIVGVLILIMLYNLVLLLHLPVQVQFLVKGSIIILATSFYAMFRRSSK